MSLSLKRRTGAILVALIGFLVILGFSLPLLVRVSDCGGNSAALAACKSVSVCYRIVASNHGNRPVSLAQFSADDRGTFAQVSGLNWLPNSKILVPTGAVDMSTKSSRQVLAVCDTVFDNVPRHVFGVAPLTHAVAYADGTVELLSTNDFQELDLSGFIDVRTISNPPGKNAGAQ